MTSDAIKSDLIVLFGFVFVALGFFGDKFYYGVAALNKLAPTWLGRLFFVSIGSVFMLFGFAHLFWGYGTIR